MGFETWAANYNVEPPANGIHWDWYDDNRYVHSVCLFDLFTPALKAGYQAKYGGGAGKEGGAIYRTKEPLCGTTSQDEPGTLSGFWFPTLDNSTPADLSVSSKSGPQYGVNLGISFIRHNFEPDKALIVEGGGLIGGGAMIFFTPKDSGTIDRDPITVTPGQTLYCYNASGGLYEMLTAKLLAGDHRFVVQLADPTHVTVDLQVGACTGSEILGPNAITYLR